MTTHQSKPQTRKEILLLIRAAILAVTLILSAGCDAEPTPAPIPDSIEGNSTSASTAAVSNINALGVVRPATTLALSFSASGPLASLPVGVGTEVRQGDSLAELDTAVLTLELESARQDVVLAQAALDALVGPPDPDRVARLEAEHDAEVAAAELALETAQAAQLAAEKAHSLALAEAAAAVDRWQLAVEYARQNAVSNPAATIAAVRLEQARSALADAQEAYDRAWDTARDWESYMTKPTAPYDGAPATGPSLSKQLEAERKGSERALAAAEAELTIAQTEYSSALAAGSDQNHQLQTLEAELALAELQLESLSQEADPVSAAAVALAELELDRLAAWQNPLLEPAAAEEITAAHARLRQVELVFERLELGLDGAHVRAPFDGLIAAIHVQPGEWVAPGSPVVEIIDTRHWLIETRNVGELTIGRVELGMEASVQINAFGGETFSGQVIAISPVAVVQQGDTTYTLTIELEVPPDLNLRSGMTARVEIRLD
jgi:multidrug resistance efflux pump